MTHDEAIKWLSDELMFLERPNVNKGSGLEKKIAVCQMAIDAIREQEERENPKPLTLDELRETHAPVWCSCKLLDGGNGFWCLCINGKIIAPSGDSFDVKEIPHWVFLRNKPKEDAT